MHIPRPALSAAESEGCCLGSGGSCNVVPPPGRLETTEFIFSWFWSPESELVQPVGLAASGGSEGDSFQAPLQLLGAAGNLWHFLACSCIVTVPASVLTSPPPGVCVSSFLSGCQSYWIKGPLLWYDLTLPSSSCNTLYPSKVTFRGPWH